MSNRSQKSPAIACSALVVLIALWMTVSAESNPFIKVEPYRGELQTIGPNRSRTEERGQMSGLDGEVFRRVGSWPYGAAQAAAFDSLRHLVYVSSGGAVLVLDMSNPTTNPRLLSDKIHTLGLVEDIHYDHATQRLFLACGEGGLEIWDVQDPSKPLQLCVYEVLEYGFETPVGNVDVLGDYAIVECAWGYVKSLDVSDPRNPVVVGGSGEMGNAANDIYISEDDMVHTVGAQAYVRFIIYPDGSLHSNGYYDDWTGSAFVVAGTSEAAFAHQDRYIYIIDPDGYNYVYSVIEVGRNMDDIDVQGDYVYYTSLFDLVILDVSNLYNPRRVGSITLPGAPTKLDVVGDYAFLGGGFAGLRIVDISDPTAPQEVGFYETLGATVDMCRSGDYAYLAEIDDGMLILDLTGSTSPVSSPLTPELVGQYDTPGYTYDIAVVDSYAYLADWDGGLRIVDISDPTDPSEVGVGDMEHAYVVCVSGDYAYVIDNIVNFPDTLRVFNISDPSNPIEVGIRFMQSEVPALDISGNYLYAAAGDSGMRVLNISDPHFPVEVGSYLAPDVRDVKVSGNYACLASADWDGGFLTLDISDPTRPRLVSTYYYSGFFPGDVALSGDFAYVSDPSRNLLLLLSISDPTNPAKLDEYTPPGSMSELYALDSLVYVSDGAAGLLILDNELFGSPGGVLNWEPQESGTNVHLRCVHFADSRTGWVVGDGGTILKTEDAGETWSPQTSGTGEDLASVFFLDRTTGWAGGREGVILKTTDGGEPWFPQSSGTNGQIRSIQFVNENVGWAVGGSGVILKTADGGDHWKPQTSGTSEFLEWVSFVDSLHGWIAVLDEGVTLKTTDGGNQWETVYAQTQAKLTSVSFVTEEIGWVTGEDATIMKTTDGGTVWIEQYSDPETPYCWLSSICCLDEQTGWAVGNIALEGQSFRTTDGGDEWSKMYGGDETYLQSVHFVDELNGWAVGQYGTILKSVVE